MNSDIKPPSARSPRRAAALGPLLKAQQKIARDFAAHRQRPPRAPAKARAVALDPAFTARAALQAMLLEALRQFQANVPGVFGGDAEFVHQARVALRRLRSALQMAAAIGADARWQYFDTETRWLARLLGDVRDLDVLLSQILPPIETALMKTANFAALRQALQARRENCRVELEAALNSDRYTALPTQLLQWLNEAENTAQPPQVSLRCFAGRALQKQRRRVRRLARRWQALDAEQRHALRKKTKALRYASEFFASLYKTKDVERYLQKLRDLQEPLGALNDYASAQNWIDQLARRDAALAHQAGLAVGWLACATQQAETGVARMVKQVSKTRPFW